MYKIRIAWFNRQINKYDFGSWRDCKDIDTDIKWVNKQNREYPFCKYWIELLPENEGDYSFPINIECIDGLLKIKRENTENTNNVVDYLLV